MPRSLTPKQRDRYWNLSDNLVIDCARACIRRNRTDEKYILEYLHTYYSRYGLPSSIFARLLYQKGGWHAWNESNLLERVEFYLQATPTIQKKLGILSCSR